MLKTDLANYYEDLQYLIYEKDYNIEEMEANLCAKLSLLNELESLKSTSKISTDDYNTHQTEMIKSINEVSKGLKNFSSGFLLDNHFIQRLKLNDKDREHLRVALMIYDNFGQERSHESHMIFSVTSSMTTFNDSLLSDLEVPELKAHATKLLINLDKYKRIPKEKYRFIEEFIDKLDREYSGVSNMSEQDREVNMQKVDNLSLDFERSLHV